MATSFGLQAAGAAAAYGSQLYLARRLGPSNYGTFATTFAIAAVAAAIAGAGLPAAAMRFVPEYQLTGQIASLGSFVWWSRRVSIAVGAVLAAAALAPVAFLAHGSGRTALLFGLPLIPFMALLTLNSEVLRSMGRTVHGYGPFLVLRPVVLIGIAAVAFMVTGSADAPTAVASSVIATCLVLWIQGLLSRSSELTAARSGAVLPDARNWLGVGVALLLSSASLMLITQTDVLVVAATRGAHDAGIYAAAARTALLLNLIGTAVNSIAAPRFSRLAAQRDADGLQDAATAAAFWAFVPSIALAVIFATAASPVLGVFGGGYAAGAWALRILLFGQLVNVAAGSVGFLLTATGHQRSATRAYVAFAALNIAFCIPLSVWFGRNGAALATALSMAGVNLLLSRVVRARTGIDPSVARLLTSPA